MAFALSYYLNIYHTCDSLKVSSLEIEYKLYDLILKFLVIRLDDKELESAMNREYAGDVEEKEELKRGKMN